MKARYVGVCHGCGAYTQPRIAGSARMTVLASSGKARTVDYQAGDVGVIPYAKGHYVQNTGGDKLAREVPPRPFRRRFAH